MDQDDLPFAGFAEDRLPAGQEPIETSNVVRTHSFLDLVMQSPADTGYNSMAVITAPAGCGKSITARHLADKLQILSHTGLPPVIVIKVEHDISTIALATAVLHQLRESPHSYKGYQLAREAGAAIVDHDLRLMIFDEADRLNQPTFELIRQLIDKTGCPTALVGLPRLLRVIAEQEKFLSRIGARMSFQPLEAQEMIERFLPKLTLPHWTFDPAREEDQVMGLALWQRVSPSLRKLRSVLQYASVIAEIREASKITPAILEEAFTWTGADQWAKDARRSHQPPPGKYEAESQDRHDAKDQQEPGTLT